MPSHDLLIAFFIATAVFAYMPGPAMLYTAAQTIARGQRAGWMASLGIHVGGYVHVIAAALGLAVLFQAVPVLYVAVKFAGAAYLVWLGIKLFFSKASVSVSSIQLDAKSPRRAFYESVTVEVLNPKTAISCHHSPGRRCYPSTLSASMRWMPSLAAGPRGKPVEPAGSDRRERGMSSTM